VLLPPRQPAPAVAPVQLVALLQAQLTAREQPEDAQPLGVQKPWAAPVRYGLAAQDG